MTVEFDRIPALQLTLSDLVWDDHPGRQRWLRVVGLAVDADQVVVTCAGDDQVLRMPADALVGVRRLITTVPRTGDDTELRDQFSGDHPGDIASASAAVAAHSRSSQAPVASTRPYPNSHYEGLYGGDLDHVLDAVGGTPNDRTRGLRDAAMRRHLADPNYGSEVAEPTAESDEELAERLAGWYAGDIGHIVDNREP